MKLDTWLNHNFITCIIGFCCVYGYASETCSVKEESKISTVVCNISKVLSLTHSASDKPMFRLISGVEPGNYLTVDKSTGILTVNGRVNREDICPNTELDTARLNQDCEIKLTIAYRANPSAAMRFDHVTVTVLDINDNPPYFEIPYVKIEIPENTPPQNVYELKRAVDTDEGSNGLISYKIEGAAQSLFSLEEERSSGGLKLRASRQFDREKVEGYTLLIVATDKAKPFNSATMTLQIDITNVNDHRPEFPRTFYLKRVPENTQVNTVLLSVTAKDQDVSDQVTYKMSESADLQTRRTFQVTRSGDILLSKQLDYEKHKEYKLPIVAQDNGFPQQSSSTTITIKVQDINDHQPKVTIRSTRDDKKLIVMENKKPGTFVGMVIASDGDVDKNGEVECKLRTNGDFRLDPISVFTKPVQYTLVTEKQFDREDQDKYDLEVTCSDKGEPQQKKSIFFTVYIGDINDSGPRFSESTIQAEVKENQKSGIQVIQLQANDPDEGDNRKTVYKLDPKYSELFRIDSKSGNVYTMQTFDREVNQSVFFRATAMDAQDPTMSTTVTVIVRIRDLNDCPPIFSQNYTFHVAENEISARAGKLTATDCDEGDNGQLRYYLTDTKYQHQWRITQSGVLYVAQGQRLDRETTPEYRLNVVAADRGNPILSASTLVHIIVTDTNDHGPRFLFPSDHNNSVNVSSHIRPGMTIATLKAIDRDEGVNAKIVYSLGYTQLIKTPFRLDNQTGELSLSESMPLDTHRIYKLIVTAIDGGVPQRRGSAVLTLNFDGGRIREPSLPTGDAISSHRLSRNLLIAFGIGLAILVLCCLILLLSYFCYYVQLNRAPAAAVPHHRQKANCLSGIFSFSEHPSLGSNGEKSHQDEQGIPGEKHGLTLEASGMYPKSKDYHGLMTEMKIGARPVTHRENINELEAMLYTKLDNSGDDCCDELSPYGKLTRATIGTNAYWVYAPEPDRVIGGGSGEHSSAPSTDPTRRRYFPLSGGRSGGTMSPVPQLNATLSTSSEEVKRILALGGLHSRIPIPTSELAGGGGHIQAERPPTESDYAPERAVMFTGGAGARTLSSGAAGSSGGIGGKPATIFQPEYSTLAETSKTMKRMASRQGGYVYGSPYMTSSFV